jgi:hypothetical protein
MRVPNILCAAACVLALGGCAATTSPEWDRQFGDSARVLNAQQLVETAPGPMAARRARRWMSM